MDDDKSTFDEVSARALINGTWRDAERTHRITDPYRGTHVGLMPVSTKKDLDEALEAARRASVIMGQMPGHERARLINRIADNVLNRAAVISEVMARESGKAIKDARIEVQRSAETLRLAAEEAVRIQGEHIPMDASAHGAGKIAMLLRFPVGVVAAITPFNAPLNLAVHKLGPALAAGNSVVIKPSPKAPLCVHLLMEAVVEAGAPPGSVTALYGDDIGADLVSDPRVNFVSFTGSIPVGKIIRNNAGMKRVALELGGVGPTFVADDADVQAAAVACARNGLLLAGQSCVSVQNVFVHDSVYDSFVDEVQREAASIRFGDPLDRATEVGTLIDEASAVRVEAMIHQALDRGGSLLAGGCRQGAQFDATLLTDVDSTMLVTTDEIFGPVMSVQRYADIDPIFKAISDSPYGLQAGIFTNSLDLALKAFRNLHTGGVIVNGTSRWRADQMPYGGVKDSGIGREGPKFAIKDMTEERLLVING